jgi:hypothetical protein
VSYSNQLVLCSPQRSYMAKNIRNSIAKIFNLYVCIQTHNSTHNTININNNYSALFISIPICSHSLPFTPIRSHSLPFAPIRSHSLPFTPIRSHSLPFASIHSHSLPFTPIRSHSLPFAPIRCHSLLFDSIHSHYYKTNFYHLF